MTEINRARGNFAPRGGSANHGAPLRSLAYRSHVVEEKSLLLLMLLTSMGCSAPTESSTASARADPLWSAGPAMTTPRWWHVTALLTDGRLLAAV